MRTTLLFAACMALVACGREAPEQPPIESRVSEVERCSADAIAKLVSAPHDVPSRAELERACDDPGSALIELGEDRSRRGLARLRAIGLLAELSGERSVTALERLALASGDLASVRRSALDGLRRATERGDVRRERTARAALSDPDPHVRRAAQRLLDP